MSLRTRLERLQNLGVEGVTNWPAIGFIDGTIRGRLEEDGLGIASEVRMLRLARQMGFTPFGFALTPEAAYTFAKSRAHALTLTVGLPRTDEGRSGKEGVSPRNS